MDHIEQQLKVTFTSHSHSDRLAAEQFLRARQKEPEYALHLIAIILRSEPPICKAAAVQLSSVFNSRLSSYPHEKTAEYSQCIVASMTDDRVELSRKKLLLDPLTKLNFMDFKFELQAELRAYVRQHATNKPNGPVTSTCLLFVQAVVESQSSQTYLIESLIEFSTILPALVLHLYESKSEQLEDGLRLVKLVLVKILFVHSNKVQNLYLTGPLSALLVQLVQLGSQSNGTIALQVINRTLELAKTCQDEVVKQSLKGTFAPLVERLFSYCYEQSSKGLALSRPVIEFITKSAAVPLLNDCVHRLADKVALGVLLPRQVTSSEQLAMIEQDPRKFISCTSDLIDHQMHPSQKTWAAKALESLVDHIHGVGNQIYQCCLAHLDNLFNGQPLPEHWSIPALMLLDVPQRVDCCLMTLTILSYSLSKRPGVAAAYEALMAKSEQVIYRADFPELLTMRLAFFICYHLQNLYQGQSDFSYLLNFHPYLSTKRGLCLRLVILDLLQNAYSDRLFTDYIKLTVNASLLSLLQYLHSSQPDEMFVLIKEILKTYHEEVQPECMGRLLEILHGLILEENSACVNNKGKDSNKLISMLNILLEICHIPALLRRHWAFIQPLLASLLEKVQRNEQVLYQDELVQCMSKSLASLQAASPVLVGLVNCLPQLLAHNNDKLGFLFEYINLLVKHHKDELVTQPEVLGKLAQAAIRVLSHQDFHSSELAEGCMLLHLLMAQFPSLFDSPTCKNITSLCAAHLKDPDHPDLFRRRLNGLLLLMAALQPELLQHESFRGGLARSLRKMSMPTQPYDARLLIIAGTKILIRQPDQELITMLVRGINLCILFLENKPVNAAMEEDDPLVEVDNGEMDKLMSQFYNPFQPIDQFSMLRAVVAQYRQADREAVLLEGLNKNEVFFFSRALQIERVMSGTARKIARVKRM